MLATDQFHRNLTGFHQRFVDLADRYDGTIHCSAELEAIIGAYSAFITDEANKHAWKQLEQLDEGPATADLSNLAIDLRQSSARCVAIMEKYRAIKLLSGEEESAGYFKNIESCIEEEFGNFQLSADSKVLLIGSGSFPMTPLYIAKRTSATVIGIDIDEEAIHLGRSVIDRLGKGLNIQLEQTFINELDGMQDVTHIIFSSTVSNKYGLLEQLHGLTNDNVIVAMRFGDGLKSLFNYPKQEVNRRQWTLVETIARPRQVFDIALYRKTGQQTDSERGLYERV
ncbi:SAM-dependent methyltransferase [Paenibacillus sp. MMS18-CY102]|uniref:SAM-dependent methyltransferase n=1 Tax=Paenibacillus sp. MMS18-CY102 TaxID=2682849 RepID=UPI00136573CF|nr:SAM-dependent methyltransferase [Paenibacillus sp. MMS18-CY102]MWC28118.1 SAM-dependent methyltransferase [Paenibacillus sp. MMS18-CY102]